MGVAAGRDAVALPASVAVGSVSPVRRSTGSAGRSQRGDVKVMVTPSETSARKRGLLPLPLPNAASSTSQSRATASRLAVPREYRAGARRSRV